MNAHHAGAGQTITVIRQSYLIPSVRHCVNYLLRRCIRYQKVFGKPYTKTTSPPLPKDRVKDVKPFLTTGIDITGRPQVTFKVICPVLAEIECVINDWPMTYISSELERFATVDAISEVEKI